MNRIDQAIDLTEEARARRAFSRWWKHVVMAYVAGDTGVAHLAQLNKTTAWTVWWAAWQAAHGTQHYPRRNAHGRS